jgi:hypothetical protein
MRAYNLNIGEGTSVYAQFADMKTAMKTRIINSLGLTGVTNADAMAEALVIQLAQDQEEYRAFIDDITGEHLMDGWLANYAGPVASVSPQSAVRLAAVSPEANFDPNAVKTSYGKPFEQYTGNYTPYGA